MNKAWKTWLPGSFGALMGIAIVAAFGSGVVPADSGELEQAFSAGATLGRAVAEFTALGLALGLIAFAVRRLVEQLAGMRRFGGRVARTIGERARATTVMVIPRLADATASEFDDRALPVFAPVTSLTEAQVERDRARRGRSYAGMSGHSARVR